MKGQPSPQEIMEDLHRRCGEALQRAFSPEFRALNGASYGFALDFDAWNKNLSGRQEQILYTAASSEYILAFLSNCQSQYRNAFKSLRLVLELVLQGAYVSTNLVALSEWVSNQGDTSWGAIVDREKGLFSSRFCRAFFPELLETVSVFGGLSETLYREMSECTHGNLPHHIPLPEKIEFHKETFELWHEKAGTLRYIVNFALTMRYWREFTGVQKDALRLVVTDQLNHIEPIRQAAGGSTSS